LNDHIKKQAEVFYKDPGQSVNFLDMCNGNIATNPGDVGQYMQSAKEDRLEATMQGGIAFAGKKAKSR
jgi:carboxymethylenebutenolidase